MHLTTSAADFSKETLVVKEEETYDAGVFEKVEAEVVKLLNIYLFFLLWKSIEALDVHEKKLTDEETQQRVVKKEEGPPRGLQPRLTQTKERKEQ